MVENQRQALKVLQYVYNTKTALNFGALFADGTDSYRHPAELKIGDSVTLRFRTGRNKVDAVTCRWKAVTSYLIIMHIPFPR